MKNFINKKKKFNIYNKKSKIRRNLKKDFKNKKKKIFELSEENKRLNKVILKIYSES